MSSRFGPLPVGFVPPCLPSGSKAPPSGKEWLHEIKHDGFRVIARKVNERVKLDSRPGNNLTRRFPLIVEAVSKLRASSCIIDGEAVACGKDGIACFELLLVRWDADGGVFLYAFDLIELDGDDLRYHRLAVRKKTTRRSIKSRHMTQSPISHQSRCLLNSPWCCVRARTFLPVTSRSSSAT
jgi:bifunctional non-homologous end joining protein LigD